jgi:general stress protein CsbA
VHHGKGKRDATSVIRLIRLAGVFVLFLFLLSAVWSFVAPGYNRVILGIASPVFSLLESPDVTVGQATGGDVYIYRDIGDGHEPVLFARFTQYAFVGLVPLLALFLASPYLGMTRRLKLTAVGVLVMGAFHVGYLVAAVELGYVFTGLTHVGRLEYGICDWIQVLFRVTWESSAVLIWALLVAKDWFGGGLRHVSGHGGARGALDGSHVRRRRRARATGWC